MLKIGITGGIGSGKTTVSKLFAELGIPVYYTDIEAKRLADDEPELVKQIVKAFGKELYVDGKMVHSLMASIVFVDKQKLQVLNDMVHPFVTRDWEVWASKQTAPYVIREVAILFETGAEKGLDYVIGVSAPEEVRIERVMKRNGLTRQQVQDRIRSQMEEEEKMRRCDFIVRNGGDDDIVTQVKKLDEKFLDT